jgi:hypothetical protein
MSNGRFIQVVKSDYIIIAGLVIAIGQLSFIGTLFTKKMESWQIYIICLVAFCLMIYFSRRHFKEAKQHRLRSGTRRFYRYMGFIYIILAVLSLLPAGYRWAYLHTDMLDQEEPPPPIETGYLPISLLPTASAATTQNNLQVDMYLDPLRSSLVCRKSSGLQVIRYQK